MMAAKEKAETEPVLRHVSKEEAKRDAEAHAARTKRASAAIAEPVDKSAGRLSVIAKLAEEATGVLELTTKFVAAGSDASGRVIDLQAKQFAELAPLSAGVIYGVELSW